MSWTLKALWAVVCCLLLLAACSEPSVREELAEAASAARPTDGRLSGGFRHAPFLPASRRPEQPDPQTAPVLRTAHRRAADAGDSPKALADRGLLALYKGNVDRAVELFGKAADQEPNNAQWWSDLAAAWLGAPEDPRHLLSALEAANRALELDPVLPEALFNRAVALERLSLWTDARLAWDTVVGAGGDAEWIAEAQARREALDRPPEAERWESARELLASAAPGDGALESLVLEFPQRARMYAEEELLGRWAEDLLAGREAEAEEAITLARGIGDVLARAGGDRMLVESAGAAAESTGPTRGLLAAGHAAFARGLARFQEDSAAAIPLFLAARRDLAAAGSPFALWVFWHLGHCDFLAGSPEKVLEKVAELRAALDGKPYKTLAGRTEWLAGTTFLYEARSSESLDAYRRALALFTETGETGYVTGLHTALARNLTFLGDSRAAWEHRLPALQGAVALGDLNRIRITFGEAAWDVPDPRIALRFQEEALQAARKLENPGHLATALRQRASLLAKASDQEGALRGLAEAKTLAESIPGEAERQIALYELRMTELEILGENHPEGALKAADAALAEGKDRYFIPALLVEKSRALSALGRSAEAEEVIESAVSELEAQRSSVDEAMRRASYLDQAREAFARAVDLRIKNGRGAEAALDAAERARARVLFDWIASLSSRVSGRSAALGSQPRPRPAAEILRGLEPGLTVVEYLVEEDRTLAWIVRREGVALEILPAKRQRLEALVTAWRWALGGTGEALEKRRASELYAALVKPLERHLRPGDALVFVPDGPLHGAPFAALAAPETGRRLVETWPVRLAPSLNVLAACLERARRPLPPAPSVLVIAEPQVDRRLFPSLPPLRFALEEAREVARLWGARVLSGAEATKARILEELGRYDAVQFAGHTERHQENPLLSAFVVAADSRDGSLLYAHELLGRRFERTRLVVLSACSTAAGTNSPTEGSLSLASPFLAAGVPTVIASLWDVEDRASASLMTAFHRHLRQGKPPAAAFHAAQLEMLASPDPDLRAPRAWASFAFVGGE